MDWESRRKKRQEMGSAAPGNTSANVESSNSIADAWERRRTQRRQMDAGSEEARRQRSEEIDRINQSRMEQHTRNKAQELAFAGLRSTFGSLQRAQSGQTVQMTAEEAGQKYKENQAKIAELDKTVRMGAGKVHTPDVQAQLDALEQEQKELAQYIQQLEDADAMQHDSAYWAKKASHEEARLQEANAYRSGYGGVMQSGILPDTGKEQNAEAIQREYDKALEYYYAAKDAENWDRMTPELQEKAMEAAALDVNGPFEWNKNYYYEKAAEEAAKEWFGTTQAPEEKDMEGGIDWQKADVLSRSGLAPDQRADQSRENSDRLAQLRQEISDAGFDADRILDYANRLRDSQKKQQENWAMANFASSSTAGAIAATVASYGANLLSGIGSVGILAQRIFGSGSGVTGYRPVNYNAPSTIFSSVTSSTREAVSEQMGETGQFFYGTLNSAVDSAARMLVAKAIGTGFLPDSAGQAAVDRVNRIVSGAVSAQMSTQVFTDAFLAAKQSGATDDDAILDALVQASIEGITEKYSVDSILKNPNNLVLTALRNNFIAEGSEEIASDFLNTIYDELKNGSDSELRSAAQKYIDAGLDPKEAWKLVLSSYAKQVVLDGLAGGISGIAMGGAAELADYTQRLQAYTQKGQQILDSGNYDTLQALAMDVAKEGVYGKGESDLSRFAEKTAAGVKNLNENYDDMTQRQVNRATRNVGKLADRVDTVRMRQNAADIQSSLEAKGMSARDAKKAAQLISENYEGLVDPEDKDLQRVMAKPEVRETMKEIADDSNSSVRQRNYRYNLGLMGLKLDENGVAVPVRSKTGEPDAESVTMAEADKNASVEISDGVSGKMQGIKWDNGILTATVTTEAGETVSAPVEDVSMPSEMQDLVAVSKQFGESAPAVYAAYQPGMGVAEYGAAMKLASDYGYTGVSRSYADSSEYLNGLHPAQISIAYEAGHAAWTKESTETMRSQSKGTVFENRKAGKVSMKGGTVDGVTYKAVDRSGMTAQQKAAVRNITRLAQVTGINFVFYQSEKNSEGKYSGANGIYTDNTIFLDINAGATDSVTEAAILRTAAHELTHFIEQFSKSEYRALQEFMLKNLDGYKGKTIDQLVAEKQARSKKDMSFQDAMSEIVADGCEMMLQDTRIMELLASEHEGIAKKISRWLKNWVEDLKAAFTGVEAVHEEAKAMLAHAEELQKLWDNALMQALRNREQMDTTASDDTAYPAAESVGMEIDEKTESVSPTVVMSERTWTESDYVQERDQAAKEIAKAIGVSVRKAKDYIDSVNSIAKMIAEDRTRLDYFSSPGRSSFVSNVEYGGSFDFSTLCKKRRLLTGTFTAIQRALPNTALTADEILDIRNRMKDQGLEVSCGLCYVEGSRANMGQFAKEFLNLYKKYYPDAWQPNMADVNTPEGIEWVRINHPECYEQYEYFWNHYGTLKEGDKNLFASQQKPKLYQLHTEYKGEILQKFKSDSNVEEKNMNGGIRLQSFSDFEIVHLIDTMQIIMDMSRVGLAGQAYTKVPDFAWALGDTGLKINLSLIAKGVDENGRLIFDDVEGMPIDTAVELRNRYSKNVGTILVVFNDQQLIAAMADDRVDFIIPFHRSQWKKSQYEAMGLPAKTKDYTYMQNEKFIKPQFHEYRGRMVKDKATNYMPNEYWDFSKSGKENAEAYLEMCSRNNKRPKFYRLLQNNGDGSYSLKPDGSTDGYWKLLIDFKMYDNSGIGSPQMPVKPVFNMEEAQRMLNDYRGGHSNFPVAQGIVDSFVSEYKEKHKGIKYSDRDYSYEALTSKPDMNVTLVDDTAPKNRADIIHQAKKNAAGIGTFDPKTGSVSVRVNDINTDVILATNGLKHSMDRRTEVNGPVVVKAGEILQNSIRINELTPQKADAQESYVLIGAAQNNSGELYVVRSVINRFSNELSSMDVLYAINAKKESAALNAPRLADESAIRTDSIISISELLDYVNRYFPDVLPESVLKHYGYDARPEGKIGESALFQDRDTDSISNRAILANALESAAQNDIERKRLEEYRGKIDLLNSEEQKLQGLRSEIRDLSFAKGPKDTKRIKELQFEANKTANRINIIDRQLLRLEAAAPLQNVLQREKKMAYKRAEQKGKEALAAYREKATKTQREIISRYQESRAKGIDSRKRTAMRGKIKDVVNELNQYLLNGNKDKRVMMGLKKAVAEALDAVNMDTVGAEDRIARLEQEMLKAKTPEKIQDISRKIDNIREMGDRMSSRLEKLKAAYAEIRNSDDPLIANAHDEVIEAKLQSVIESVGDTPLRDMTLSQLEDVYDMYRMVLTNIRNSNKAFKAAKSQDIAVLGNNVMMEIEEAGGKKKYRLAGTDGISRFDWNNLKPVYAFERIGSRTFAEIFNNVRTGEDTWALDVTEAKAFSDAIKKKYGYKKWNFDQTHSFQSTSGMEFNLNLEQIMSLYAYSKRDQALDHLQKGGIVFDPKTQVVVKTKSGIKVKYNLTEATAYNISEATLADIVSKLTPDQKSFVDEMQDYLSTTMGEKGNEVSLELYGIKLFREKFYFPLKSASQFMAKAKEQQQGEVKIKNSGFSKETVQKANNPIVLSGFMDVWASHVNEMSMYHAFVLPMEDFYRVYNYRTPTSDTMATESVEMFLQNAYGKGATQYIDQLLKDLNGGARSDPRESAGKALVGRFKKAAVFASASVVIQQPSAVGRALALIDQKYFDFNPKLIQHKKLWAEVKKYAPVAIIKEMGYFDTDMGMSTVDYIKGEKTIMDKADDVLSWAPAMADELTWCHIWTAVKRETQAKNPGLSIRSEEFLQKAGARFTEVIVKTQVYDSVLSRSANMRSKSLYMKMLTSFMAEPTTSINMLQSAMLDLKRGYKGKAAKTIGAVVASVVLNSILVSFVYAGRDDDEDETWLEKYASSLATELVEGINPITYIPIAKDIWSLLQGYDVERADMTLFSSVTKSLTKLVKAVSVDTSDMDEEDLADHRKQVVDASWGLVDAVMSMTGIPVKNVRRDVMAAINTYKTVNNGLSNNKTSFWNEIAESVKKSLPVWGWLPDNQKSDKLYDAIVSGDTAYQERLEALYDSQNAIDSARVKALRDNDPRILEAATAAFNGDPGERVRIVREIVAEGHFSQVDVIEAINAEINKLERAENGGSESEKSSPKLYDMNDYYDAVMIGDKSTADDAKEYYLDDRIAQGDSEEDALNSFDTSFTSTIKSEYLDGNIGKDKVMSLLTTYGGSSESESETYLKKWDFEDKYGYSWDQRDNAFRLGDITMDELVDYTVAIDGDAESAAKFLYEEHEIDAGTAANMLVTYSGMKSDDAKNKVAKWEFKNVYGFSYDDRREAYISGEISAYELKKSLMDLGGMTSDEADKKIAVYDWRKRNPGTILDDNDIAAYISPIEYIGFSIEASGVSPEVFAEYRNQASKCKGVDADGDGETDSGSMKAQILLVINSLPISAEQKTALYFLNKWAASRLSDAPWY